VTVLFVIKKDMTPHVTAMLVSKKERNGQQMILSKGISN